MAESYFDPGEQRAAKVNALFARVATRYDLINDLQSFGLHRYWKQRLVQVAGPLPRTRALDLCCGTGDLTFSLAGQGADAAGLDFCEPMLAVARHRAEAHGARGSAPPNAGRLHFLRGDALHIPFRDDSFGLLTVGYGLRNLADLDAGLREMLRVTAPGGRLLALDFGKPDNPLWRNLYFGYLKLFVPCLGLVVCGSASAYSYILQSLKHYPAQRGVAEKMRALGYANVRIISFLGGIMSINYGEKAK